MDPHIISILKHEVHLIALFIMGSVYIGKIIWIMRFKPMVERTPSKGNKQKAIINSFLNIAMPWEMESTRKKWYVWTEFAIFHIGVAFAIIVSFVVSFGHESLLDNTVFLSILMVLFPVSFLITVIRLYRRLFLPVNRIISHPDDYFSIILMCVWFFFASWFVFDLYNSMIMGIYLAITAFLIAYVPFSKMSHYILWPFSRYYFGKHFGHRGVYPKIRVQ
jgi:hypothetical protein